MKKMWKIFLVIALVMGVFGYRFVLEKIQIDSTNRNLEFLHEHFNAAGELVDYQNEIRMKDPLKDIRLFVKNNKVKIKFGVIEMNWTAKQFMDETNLKKLERIYIYPEVDPETNRLTIYYKGIELSRWVS
ncbi:MAG: hypothetical protein IJE43_18975 [Alphaproteobacteria bacterium]|nr:hypothetical protein [Alphaproteobacteria bacterium]